MQVTNEIPAGKGKPYKVVGLSVLENAKFWQSEDRINALWFKSINGNLVGTVALFSLQMFIVKFDVDLWLLILMQTIHIAHNAFFLVTFLHRLVDLVSVHIQTFNRILPRQCLYFQPVPHNGDQILLKKVPIYLRESGTLQCDEHRKNEQPQIG